MNKMRIIFIMLLGFMLLALLPVACAQQTTIETWPEDVCELEDGLKLALLSSDRVNYASQQQEVLYRLEQWQARDDITIRQIKTVYVSGYLVKMELYYTEDCP